MPSASGGSRPPASGRLRVASDPLRLLLPTLAAIAALAWAALWVWQASPYGRYLNHAELAALAGSGNSFGEIAAQAGLYVAGWVLMCVAMMLPTTLPLLAAFGRLTAARSDRVRLVAWLVAGYLGVWLAFGVAAHLFDLCLHEALERVFWLQMNPWIFGAGPLLLAGLFQFSTLKYRCLERCRAPAGFVIQHWRGGDPARQSLAIGAHHGIYCVGCCWALMLLMFAVGTGNIGWMLVLGAIMAIEKNLPLGNRLGKPLGIALIAWGAVIAIDHSWTWQ